MSSLRADNNFTYAPAPKRAREVWRLEIRARSRLDASGRVLRSYALSLPKPAKVPGGFPPDVPYYRIESPAQDYLSITTLPAAVRGPLTDALAALIARYEILAARLLSLAHGELPTMGTLCCFLNLEFAPGPIVRARDQPNVAIQFCDKGDVGVLLGWAAHPQGYLSGRNPMCPALGVFGPKNYPPGQYEALTVLEAHFGADLDDFVYGARERLLAVGSGRP